MKGAKRMDNVFCSDGYIKFFDSLQGNFLDIKELLNKMQENLPLIADDVRLGKLDVCLGTPTSVFEPERKSSAVQVYCYKDGYEDVPHTATYKVGKNGEARYIAYPRTGVTWDEKECIAINFLLQNIHMLCSRSRVMGLLYKAGKTDTLTGAANADGLSQFVTELQEKNVLPNYTGVFFNIKNFKYFNQRVGSSAGDEILRKYVNQIQEYLSNEEIVARLGGDNFMAFVLKDKIENFLELIESMQVAVDFKGDKVVFDVMTRAGIYPINPEDTMGEVMNGSAVALNVARGSVNHNHIVYRPQMMEKAMHAKEVSSIFPKALRNEEFVVYYQPKVKLSDNALCGCEALVRWIRNGEIVPPMEFIPVLEQEGSICDLDFYVFEQVCKDIRRWLGMGLEPVQVSVNFSKVHLHNQKLAEQILAIADKYEIDRKYIEIELTEMSGYEDYEALSSFVNNMKQSGMHTSIDDFGTGYSSLNLLKDLKVDIIKLDRSFLSNLDKRNEPDEIVIKNIVNMVKELDMEVIAEGVETSEQAEFLKDVNCCMAQGFLFDKPLPREEFEKRLQSQSYTVKREGK